LHWQEKKPQVIRFSLIAAALPHINELRCSLDQTLHVPAAAGKLLAGLP
jgi:hypothetical protein